MTAAEKLEVIKKVATCGKTTTTASKHVNSMSKDVVINQTVMLFKTILEVIEEE